MGMEEVKLRVSSTWLTAEEANRHLRIRKYAEPRAKRKKSAAGNLKDVLAGLTRIASEQAETKTA